MTSLANFTKVSFPLPLCCASAAPAAAARPNGGVPLKLEKVGRGSYGDVWKAKRNADGAIVALKEMSMVGIGKDEEKELLNETKCMLQVALERSTRCVAGFWSCAGRCVTMLASI